MSITINNNTINLQDSANIVVPIVLDQSIIKSVYKVNGQVINGGTPVVSLGDTVVYQITVQNNGNSALQNTYILDTLPGCMIATDAYYGDYESELTQAMVTDGKMRFDVGERQNSVYTMPPDSEYTYYIKLTVNESYTMGGLQTNIATLFARTELCSDSADINLLLDTTLTIHKAGYSDYADIDPDQTFLFKVTGDGVDLTVSVHGSGSVTVSGLKPGKDYTVTEITDWAWRYGFESVSTELEDSNVSNGVKVTLKTAQSDNQITFNNTRAKNQWLDGNSYRVNNFN